MEKKCIQILPAYHRSLTWAFWCQFLGIVLGAMVLDFGYFWFSYLCITFVFWIVVGVLAFVCPKPTVIERVVIGIGPQVIFWTMFIAG